MANENIKTGIIKISFEGGDAQAGINNLGRSIDNVNDKMDGLSTTQDKLQTSTSGATQGTDKLDSSIAGLVKGFIVFKTVVGSAKAVFNIFTGAIHGAVDGTKALTEAFIEYSKRGADFQDVQVGFSKSFKDSTKALNDLRKASNGTISDFDLMLSANKAAMLGVTNDSEELARLLEIARARGQALGQDTTQAFEDIVTGIGRNSPLILDNLGITTQAYKEQVAAIEETGVELDDNAKKQILLQSVLQDTATVTNGTNTTFDRLNTLFENTKDRIGTALAPEFNDLANQVFPHLENASASLVEFFSTKIPEGIEKLKSVAQSGRNLLLEWWNENREEVIPKISELKNAFAGEGGEGGLVGAIKMLFNPTEENKEALKRLISEGVDVLLDNLPSLIENVRDFVEEIDAKEIINDTTEAVNNISDAFSKFNEGIAWLIEKKDAIEKVWNVLYATTQTITDLLTLDLRGLFSDLASITSLGEHSAGDIEKALEAQGVNRSGTGGDITKEIESISPHEGLGGSPLAGVESAISSPLVTSRGEAQRANNNFTINMNIGSVDTNQRIQEIVRAVNSVLASQNVNSKFGGV